eukprot:37978-Eustigmatos_ZCMA.PRE.1
MHQRHTNRYIARNASDVQATGGQSRTHMRRQWSVKQSGKHILTSSSIGPGRVTRAQAVELDRTSLPPRDDDTTDLKRRIQQTPH